jgi:hypothetical protein
MPHTYPDDPVQLAIAMHLRAHTVIEWFKLLERQIERAQKFDPDLADELIAIRDAMRSDQHAPHDMTGRLGALALQAQSMAVSAVNREKASRPRADGDQLAAAQATFDAWGGLAMTPEKRRECELEVAHNLSIERRKVTRWFDYFLKL